MEAFGMVVGLFATALRALHSYPNTETLIFGAKLERICSAVDMRRGMKEYWIIGIMGFTAGDFFLC